MSVTLIVSVAIVVAASVAFAVVGERYRFDLFSDAYVSWVRAIGVGALVGLGVTFAWAKWSEPALVALVAAGVVVLAVAFVLVHRRLTDAYRASAGGAKQASGSDGS